MNQEVIDYLQSPSRNKLIFLLNKISRLNPTNIGFELSRELENNLGSRLPIRAMNALNSIIESNVTVNKEIGEFVYLTNLGILFEDELKIDFANLLELQSRKRPLIIHWEGEVENHTLYFLSKEKGVKINIENLSYITI